MEVAEKLRDGGEKDFDFSWADPDSRVVPTSRRRLSLTDDLERALLRGLGALAVGGGAGVLAGVLPRHLGDEEGAVVERLVAPVLGQRLRVCRGRNACWW